MRPILFSLALSLITAPAIAQDLPSYLIFSLSRDQPKVIATNLVGGFTPEQARGFIAENCAGAVSDLMPVGHQALKKSP